MLKQAELNPCVFLHCTASVGNDFSVHLPNESALAYLRALTSFLSTALFCFSSSFWFVAADCSAAPD